MIGALAAAGISYLGQQQQNRQSAQAAQIANAASAEQAAAQMNFQERMRETQYQTAVKDMKAAGLNPMLAYTQGGAGTPTGSMGQVSTAKVGNQAASAVAGYQSMAMNQADIKLKDATTTGTTATTLKTEADTIKTATEIAYILENTKLNAQQQKNLVVQLDKLNQEIENLRATQDLTTATTGKTKAETSNIEKGIAPSADPFFYRDIKRVGEYTKDKFIKYKNLVTPSNPFKGKK
jgi:hypothetical protein